MFRGRSLLIATKHHKEKVVAPVLEKGLGVACKIAKGVDTDVLGTFTGEVERLADPVATARLKCEMALALTGYDLAISSEGSFGPHPVLGFVPVDEEILLLLDKRNNLEIVVRHLSFETNFASAEISDAEELQDFADQVLFPSHALVLRPSRYSSRGIAKGITDQALLMEKFHTLRQQGQPVVVETDMRAMYNPTRMQVIGQAAEKLLSRALSCCPKCQVPGFGVTSAKPGLPCGACGFPSRSVLSEIHTCRRCAFTQERLYPNHKAVEDPAYCQLCNP
jgi:hypothetical protein